jgi:hypothetical protein
MLPIFRRLWLRAVFMTTMENNNDKENEENRKPAAKHTRFIGHNGDPPADHSPVAHGHLGDPPEVMFSILPTARISF